jgi:serine/threonine protein kinase/DNA-binding winged helix-turn-helix (wHTH) protein
VAAERTASEVKGRIWKFGAFELEEIGRTLRKEGQPLEIRGKPLDLLICLLEAKTANVTKDELIKQVWLGYAVEESVIKVTVSTLRKILGDQEQTLILTVFKVGYRMGVPVECLEVDEVVTPRFRLSEDAPVPDKPSWHLKYALDRTTPHWVWAAKQDTNSLVRVFKFAEDGVRYGALQREITLSRLLAKAAPRATCFVKVFDWRLDTSPYYLEAEFGGINLLEWAAKLRDPESGGLPRQLCLQVIAEICDAVDIAHEIGVFHNDLKPSNILLSQPGTDAAWHVKVSDFGIATLLEPQRLVDLDITNHGFGDDPTATSVGSAMYHAPEVKPGQPSTRSADIYAIGVILYQLLSGDFSKTPTPGWQSDIDDPILQRDIEEAVNLNPSMRLKSAAELAARLRTLETRSAEEKARLKEHEKAKAALQQVERSRARRPFLVAIFVTLLLGLCAALASLWFYRKALREQATAAQINEFLTDGLLRQSNPNVGRGIDETLKQAIEDVAPEIDGRFPGKPEVAAGVHYTIAQDLDNAAQYDSAGQQYDAAAVDWIKADGPLSQDAIFAQLQHVFLDARSQRAGSVEKAKALFSQEKTRIDQLRLPEPRVLFGSLDAEGMIALAGGDVKGAESKFQSAVDIANKYPAISREIRLSAKQRLCSVQLRAGDALNAELCFRNLRAEIASSEGPEDGNLLLFDFGIAQALLFQSKFDDAIRQVDAIYPRFVKQFGADNARTLQLLGVRAEAEGDSENWDDSIRDDLTLVDVAKKTDPTGFMAVGALSDAALSECRSGKYVAGEAHARADLKTASAPGQNVGMKGVVEYSVAVCIILPQLNGSPAPSRLDEAESLLRDINVELVSALTANPGWGANIDLARAQIAFVRKNYVAASDYLAKAKPGFNSPKAELYQRQTIAKLESGIERATTRK